MVTKHTSSYKADIAVPVQCGFKHRLPDGRVLDLTLRRVKEGNDTAIELTHDGPNHVSGYGRYSNAETLLARLNDDALAQSDMAWAAQAITNLLHQAGEVSRYQPALWELFCPKGKLEIYAPIAKLFDAQYIASNYTLKWHADDVAENPQLLLRGLAQHLDYPFEPGTRRFSTTRLFDLCFAAEKVVAPKGLAGRIDAALEARGLFQPERHDISDYSHVAALLSDESAAIRNSYERVLQRERFAALIAHWYGSPIRGAQAPILQHYQQFVEMDLMLHQQHDYKKYPTKTRDELAQALHRPLALIFNPAGNSNAQHTATTTAAMG